MNLKNWAGVTFLIFLILQLTHVIDWSWWWVTAPLWGCAAYVVLVAVVYIVIYAVWPESDLGQTVKKACRIK
jgi:Transmembrane Fragile-X-F protein